MNGMPAPRFFGTVGIPGKRSLDVGPDLTRTFPRLNGRRWDRRAQVRQRTIFAKLPQCYYLRIGRDVIRRGITISIEDRIKSEYGWLSFWWSRCVKKRAPRLRVKRVKLFDSDNQWWRYWRERRVVCILIYQIWLGLEERLVGNDHGYKSRDRLIHVRPWGAYWERSRFWFLPMPTNLWTTPSKTTLIAAKLQRNHAQRIHTTAILIYLFN